MDWRGLRGEAKRQIIDAVEAVSSARPDARIYAAIVSEFSGETGGVIAWPMVTIGTEETLADVVARYRDRGDDDPELERVLRWSAPDLATDDALAFDPDEAQDAWAAQVEALAGRGDDDAWEATYRRYLEVFPAAAKDARRELIAAGVVGKGFLAVASDDDGELIPLSLTATQVERHFPEFGVRGRERTRLAELPANERIAQLVAQVVPSGPPGPLTGEYDDLLRAEGHAALPALVEAMGRRRGGVSAVILIAEIGLDDATAEALEALLLNTKADPLARNWAASALCRHGRGAFVIDNASRIPADAFAQGIADPYGPLRDRGVHDPLDFALLERALGEAPEHTARVEEHLRPGAGTCTLEPSERAAATAALSSVHPLVRRVAADMIR